MGSFSVVHLLVLLLLSGGLVALVLVIRKSTRSPPQQIDGPPVDPRPLARQTLWALAVFAVAAAGAAIGMAIEVATYARLPSTTQIGPDFSAAGAESAEMIVGVTALLLALAFVVSAVVVLRWTHRVVRNAHIMADGLRVSPGWAVGWHFVPIGNLWMPFVALRETWQVARNPTGWTQQPVSPVLRWWWGLWLVVNVASNVTLRLSARATSIAEALPVAIVDLVLTLLLLPLTALLATVIHRLSAAQGAVLFPAAPKPADAPPDA